MRHLTNYDELIQNMKKAVEFEIKRAGFRSVYTFCRKAGLPKTTICDCLRDGKDPTLRTVVTIANALGIPVIKLLNFMRAETTGDNYESKCTETEMGNLGKGSCG